MPIATSGASRADVLILGAGPAGCAAALCARQAGLVTVMLEAQAEVRPAPGETLHPGVEVIFRQLNV
ncbi:MAG TPA: FAD-binding protein, partial [Methylomirabilota bacterium]|nr:FAD-binding protein [Methylomirabilota bacterium]